MVETHGRSSKISKMVPAKLYWSLYHKNQELQKDYDIISNGGRILNVVGFGKDLESAINDAYDIAKSIEASRKGRTEIKLDSASVIHFNVGKSDRPTGVKRGYLAWRALIKLISLRRFLSLLPS